MDYSKYDLIPFGPFLEEWKDVRGYEGRYLVSNYGNVISCEIRLNCHNGKGWRIKKETFVKKQISNHKGSKYFRVCLWKDGVGKKFNVHRLVAIAFIENIEKKPIINHIRGFTQDNLFTQLEWSTYKENELHSHRFLGKKTYNKGLRRANNFSKPILQLSINGDVIRRFEYASLVDTHGFNPAHVLGCCRGKRLTHKKFKWSYA